MELPLLMPFVIDCAILLFVTREDGSSIATGRGDRPDS
jgi:hypothetical protein